MHYLHSLVSFDFMCIFKSHTISLDCNWLFILVPTECYLLPKIQALLGTCLSIPFHNVLCLALSLCPCQNCLSLPASLFSLSFCAVLSHTPVYVNLPQSLNCITEPPSSSSISRMKPSFLLFLNNKIYLCSQHCTFVIFVFYNFLIF